MENYGKFTEIYKRIRSYPSMSIPPGTDAEKSSMGVGSTLIKWDSPFYSHPLDGFRSDLRCPVAKGALPLTGP